MNSKEIRQATVAVLNDTTLDAKTTSNQLIRLQALATVDSAETYWAVTAMMEPFIMVLREKNH